MDWTWARPVGQSGLHRYINELVATVSALAYQGCEVKLLGHSHMPEQNQDDPEIARKILERIQSRGCIQSITIDTNTHVDSLRSTFSSLDVVIGTRLHSCILSLTASTPAIVLAYQPKARETYELLGLEDLCLDVEDFTSVQLAQLVANIIHDTDGYIARVRTAVEEAQQVISKCYTIIEKNSLGTLME
jgi:colanic acid/amylovoran biosynthesis protein